MRSPRSRPATALAAVAVAAVPLWGPVGASEVAGASGEQVDRLTIAVTADFGPVNLFKGTDEKLLDLVYDRLLSPSPFVDEPQPWLAESITAVDPSVWEIVVRDGVTWHDGEPFTAEDVAFTFDYLHIIPTSRWGHHVTEVPHILSSEVVSDDTVRLTCAYPCPDLGRITLADLPIIPEHIWNGVTEPGQVTDMPVGTGPYRLTDYDPVAGYTFAANADYFAGTPVVDELVMPIISDANGIFTALTTGEIDGASRVVSPELIDQLDGGDTRVVTTRPLQFTELRLNYRQVPFDDPEFRRAVSRSIDRTEMVDIVLLGQGRESTTGYPHPDSPWTSPNLSTPTDQAEAGSILDDLGYADTDDDGRREYPAGTELALTILVNGGEPTMVRAAELAAEHLSEVGLDTTIEALDAASLTEASTAETYDMTIGSIGSHGVADPTQFIMSHRSGYLWEADLPYPEFDALFEEWKATTTIEDRRTVAWEMQELFNEQPTSIPLYYPDEAWAFRPDAYDGWVESPGFGIFHRWSLLPREVSESASAISQTFD